MRRLCRLDEIEPEGSRGFGDLFAVRLGDSVHVYVNSCPHIGVPLDWAPDRFLSTDGTRIICSMHGAEFRIEDGVCTLGPCLGDRLEAVMIEIKDGVIMVPVDAGL